MKFIASEMMSLFHLSASPRSYKLLFGFLALLVGLVAVFTVLFHLIMLYEGRNYSWFSGLYWTLTTMTTLGFGDITFISDPGKIFSIVVLMSGVVLLLIVLPFTFVQFFYAPWLEAQSRARAPRELPEDTTGHVIFTNFDSITAHLVPRLAQYKVPYAILVQDTAAATGLYDQGYRVVVGANDDPETYRKLRVDRAALVVATGDDMINTNIAFTVREMGPLVPIVTNANNSESVDILEMAGSTEVFQFTKMLGESLARRTIGSNMASNVIGRFDGLLIAEAPAMRTPLEGKTLVESRLRETAGVNVVGIWERGFFELPSPTSRITAATVLLLAGSAEQLECYDRQYGFRSAKPAPVLILGGGQVGQAAADALESREMDYRVVEKNPKLVKEGGRFLLGSAADIRTLERAGIREAPSVIITTHNDPLNIYLTIYCRRLRPDIQIVCRATLERNVTTLHKAGADLVMSYSSMSASTIFNLLRPNDLLMLTEGLNVFRMTVPKALVGKTLIESQIRQKTGCSVIALQVGPELRINPDPRVPLEQEEELILIGSELSETELVRCYPEGK